MKPKHEFSVWEDYKYSIAGLFVLLLPVLVLLFWLFAIFG